VLQNANEIPSERRTFFVSYDNYEVKLGLGLALGFSFRFSSDEYKNVCSNFVLVAFCSDGFEPLT